MTGGTGSFGQTFVQHVLNKNAEKVICFSRDEKKQYDLQCKISDPRLVYAIGDVVDYSSIQRVIDGVDLVIHCAAMKQVPASENNPFQAVQTNIFGSQNVLDAAIYGGVSDLIFLSTDKAVHPVNAMGISKAMAEKLMITKSATVRGSTRISVTRYGNVLSSRGSVIPYFKSSLAKNQPLTVTHPQMTRFLMSLDESVALVDAVVRSGDNGAIYVKCQPAANIENLARSMMRLTGVETEIIYTGVRRGEKLHEQLVSDEELRHCKLKDGFFKIFPAENPAFDEVDPCDLKHNWRQVRSDTTEQLQSSTLDDFLVERLGEHYFNLGKS